MCSRPKAPSPPPQVVQPPPAAPPPPAPVVAQAEMQDPDVTRARDNERLRRRRGVESNNTLVTGGAGLQSEASTATKTLFGS